MRRGGELRGRERDLEQPCLDLPDPLNSSDVMEAKKPTGLSFTEE